MHTPWAHFHILLDDESTRRFIGLSAAFLCMLTFSCYTEEWIFKALPGFDFPWAVALVELACFVPASAFQEYIQTSGGEGKSERKAPLPLYLLTALCLALSQSFGKVVIRYLNYATGTILKSAKLVPTLLLSVLWLRRSVRPQEWVAACLLVASAALMALGEQAVDLSFNPLGLLYAAANLALAALQGNLQERILKDHNASISEAMLYTNGLGIPIVLVAMVINQELVPACWYFFASPYALALLLIRSITFYAGAVAYNKLTKESGTGASTAVGTARKSLTVLLSFWLFPKPFHRNYAFGVVSFLAADVLYLHLHARRAAERRRTAAASPDQSPRQYDYERVDTVPQEEEELGVASGLSKHHAVKPTQIGSSTLEMSKV